MSLLFVLLLPLQDAEKVAKYVEQLRGTPEQRKEATDALLRMKSREPKVRDLLVECLKKETDPRVQARLEHILRTLDLVPVWEVLLSSQAGCTGVASEDWLVLSSPSDRTALRAKDGETAWSQKQNGDWPGGAIIAGEFLLALDSKQTELRYARLEDGKWKTLGRIKSSYGNRIESDGKYVAYAGDLNKVICQEISSGRRIREIASTPSSFVLSEGRLYYTDERVQVCGLDIASGKLLWSAERDVRKNYFLPVGASSDRLVAAGARGGFVALSKKDGKTLWENDSDGFVSGYGVTILEGHALGHARDASLGCLDLANGKRLWSRSGVEVARTMGRRLMAAGGCLAIWDRNELALVDLRTGSEEWRGEPVKGTVTSWAAAGKRIYGVTRDRVAAFEVAR